MNHGYRAPIVRIFNASDTLVFEGVTRFRYSRSERVDDGTSIVIETTNLDLVDHPDLQEHKQIKVVWGYSGTDKMTKRLVYIWDVKASFGTHGLRMELEAFCKAAYMKLNSAKDVYEDASTKDVLEEMAEAYGLNFEDQTSPEDDYEKSDPNAITPEYSGGQTQSDLYLKGNDTGIVGVTVARDNTAYILPKPYDWKKQAAIAQANASDAKLVDDLIKKEPTDNLFLDGVDDDLIIKKRNFMQKPYKGYTFRAEPGYLIDFNPASHNTNRKKSAISNTVASWIEDEWEFNQAQIDRSVSGAGVLGDSVELSLEQNLINKVAEEVSNPADRPLSMDGLAQLEYQGVGEDGQPIKRLVMTQQLDTTKQAFVFFRKQGTQPSQIQVRNKHMFHTAAIDNVGRIETKGMVIVDPKEYIPTTQTSPEKAAGEGVNRQAQQELELYESTAMMIGDPDLVCSKVISIGGVGKKYSGNYYVVSVDHEITKEAGYLCYVTLYRTSHNKIGEGDLNKIAAADYGYAKNVQQINPEDGTSTMVKIPTASDE